MIIKNKISKWILKRRKGMSNIKIWNDIDEDYEEEDDDDEEMLFDFVNKNEFI